MLTRVIPIGIERCRGFVTVCHHPVDGCLPFCLVWKIEHEEIILCRSPACTVTPLMREFQVISGARQAEHDAVKPRVVLKRTELRKAESVAVKAHYCFELVGWSR